MLIQAPVGVAAFEGGKITKKSTFSMTYSGPIISLLLVSGCLFAIAPVVEAQIQISASGAGSFVGNDVSSNGVLFAGDKAFNIYKSIDNGVSFTKIYTLPGIYDGLNPHSGLVWNLFIDSRGYIFASASGTGGLFRSTNGGGSFIQVLKTNGTSLESFYISMTEDNNGYLYTVTYTNGGAIPYILKSTDDGATWTRIAQFNVIHYHNIKFNPVNGYLYVATGEGPLADCGKILRSTNGGTSWATIVQRNDNLGTVYLAMTFSNNWVYLGQDYPNRVCQIHRFYDDGSVSFNPQTVYTPPSDGYMPMISATKLGSNLVFANTAENANGVGRIVTSVDGTSWTVIKTQTLSYTTDNRWNLLTIHPRSGIVFGTMKPGDNYKIIDGPMPTPTASPTLSPTPTTTPKPTATATPTSTSTTTPVPTVTSTPTPTPPTTPIPTPEETATPTPTPAPSPSSTTEPTTHPTSLPTVPPQDPKTNNAPKSTPKATSTNTQKPTPTQTTQTPTSTTTPTPTPTPQTNNPSILTGFYANVLIVAVTVIGASFASVAIAKRTSIEDT